MKGKFISLTEKIFDKNDHITQITYSNTFIEEIIQGNIDINKFYRHQYRISKVALSLHNALYTVGKNLVNTVCYANDGTLELLDVSPKAFNDLTKDECKFFLYSSAQLKNISERVIEFLKKNALPQLESIKIIDNKTSNQNIILEFDIYTTKLCEAYEILELIGIILSMCKIRDELSRYIKSHNIKLEANPLPVRDWINTVINCDFNEDYRRLRKICDKIGNNLSIEEYNKIEIGFKKSHLFLWHMYHKLYYEPL